MRSVAALKTPTPDQRTHPEWTLQHTVRGDARPTDSHATRPDNGGRSGREEVSKCRCRRSDLRLELEERGRGYDGEKSESFEMVRSIQAERKKRENVRSESKPYEKGLETDQTYEMTVTFRATARTFSSSEGLQSEGIGSQINLASSQPRPLTSSMISPARRGEQTKWM
jgi:hypothetical protein